MLLAICTAPPTLVTVTPDTAASTIAFTSATVTASTLATLPVPLWIAPNEKGAAPVPPVTLTEDPVPILSLLMRTAFVLTSARPPTIAALMTAATSSAVAAPIATKEAVRKVTVWAAPPSMATSSVWPLESAYVPAFPAVSAAATAAMVAVAVPLASLETCSVSPTASGYGPTTVPSTLAADATSAAVWNVVVPWVLVFEFAFVTSEKCTTREM